jgi:peptidoglycan/xylan/chitin deacetylase (PgdA/CDA1 family)
MRTSSGILAWAGILGISATACGLDESPDTSQVVTLATYPEIDFSTRPSYLPNNVVVLTFDDGPDWNNTARVLDVLQQKNARATFFINTVNWSNVDTDAPMQELVRRMVREGHELANHSVRHLSLPSLSAARIEEEVVGVQNTVNRVIGAGAPRLTLFRAPFGEPYQGSDPNFPSPGYQLVAPVVARHAVHIGWGIDSFDYRCAMGDGACVLANVRNALQRPGSGQYGVILMHSVHSQTVAALPGIIDYIRANGFQIWSTEDVVRARYGRSSAELVDGAPPGPDARTPDAGTRPPDARTPDAGARPDAGTGPCNAPAYRSGVAYGPGERVSNVGSIYQCKPWPYSGWCGAGSAYEPGVGWAWQDAWDRVGACAGVASADLSAIPAFAHEPHRCQH